MAAMNAIIPNLMQADEFLRWSQAQDRGRYELEGGRIVAIEAENVGHITTKRRASDALSAAIAAAGAPCYALPDGAAVRITENRVYEPDALVAPLPMPPDDALEIPNPIIVVEVLSPSPPSQRRDLTTKVEGYGRVATIAYYLVIDPVDRQVLLYRREGGVLVPPAAPCEGVIHLDPPGIEVPVEALLAPERRVA